MQSTASEEEVRCPQCQEMVDAAEIDSGYPSCVRCWVLSTPEIGCYAYVCHLVFLRQPIPRSLERHLPQNQKEFELLLAYVQDVRQKVALSEAFKNLQALRQFSGLL